jgi:hypothetical protein
VVGRFSTVNHHPQVILNNPINEWLYDHALRACGTTECVQLDDYLFRHDRGALNLGKYCFGKLLLNTWTRRLTDAAHRSSPITRTAQALHWADHLFIQDLVIFEDDPIDDFGGSLCQPGRLSPNVIQELAHHLIVGRLVFSTGIGSFAGWLFADSSENGTDVVHAFRVHASGYGLDARSEDGVEGEFRVQFCDSQLSSFSLLVYVSLLPSDPCGISTRQFERLLDSPDHALLVDVRVLFNVRVVRQLDMSVSACALRSKSIPTSRLSHLE